MKQEYVNPILAPAALVWEKEVGHPLQFESAEAISHKYTSEDITAAVGVSGQVRGKVLYGFPLHTARAPIDIMVSSDTDLPLGAGAIRSGRAGQHDNRQRGD